MPIAGVVDPSHKERIRSKYGAELPKWYPVDYLMKLAYENDDPHWSPFTYELLSNALSEDRDSYYGDRITTTMLESPCPRSNIIARKEEYIEDVDELWMRFRGSMVHSSLEQHARPNSISEVRFFAKVEDDEISGTPDLITQAGTMWDYKTGKVPRWADPMPWHVEQLQINRWIVNNAHMWKKGDEENPPVPFDPRALDFQHLAILYMDDNGPVPLEFMERIDIPTKKGAKNPYKKVKVPGIWDDAKVLDMMMPRFKAMRAALESYPEFPKGVEKLWGGDNTWECPGPPYCPLRGMCLASRFPDALIW